MIVAGDGEGQVEECVHEQQELDGDGPGGRLSTARLHWGRVASLVWILFALQTLALVINVQCLNENLVSGLITLICFNRRTYCFWAEIGSTYPSHLLSPASDKCIKLVQVRAPQLFKSQLDHEADSLPGPR